MTNKEKLAYELVKSSLRNDLIDIESFFPREVREACLKALEKQIPKKPINLNCPNCGFDRIDNSWWVFTYCPKCGQLLDWEEEDEQQGSNRDIKEYQTSK